MQCSYTREHQTCVCGSGYGAKKVNDILRDWDNIKPINDKSYPRRRSDIIWTRSAASLDLDMVDRKGTVPLDLAEHRNKLRERLFDDSRNLALVGTKPARADEPSRGHNMKEKFAVLHEVMKCQNAKNKKGDVRIYVCRWNKQKTRRRRRSRTISAYNNCDWLY